ncbi:MAG: hypothetical protein HUJ25_16020 [Crocinitomicaceae bacterium]|nr:hypothetical protein [Crocinitomicaceae bacterium]
MIEEVHIPLNRSKLLVQIVVLSILGIGALVTAFGLSDQMPGSPLILKGFGIVTCLFCLVAAGSIAKKRADKQAGVTINKEGILDTSSSISIGLIKWKDVTSVDKDESMAAGLLIIHVKNQNEYLKKAKNSAIERLLKQNLRKFDTPVVIEAKYLDCSLEELIDTVIERYRK